MLASGLKCPLRNPQVFYSLFKFPDSPWESTSMDLITQLPEPLMFGWSMPLHGGSSRLDAAGLVGPALSCLVVRRCRQGLTASRSMCRWLIDLPMLKPCCDPILVLVCTCLWRLLAAMDQVHLHVDWSIWAEYPALMQNLKLHEIIVSCAIGTPTNTATHEDCLLFVPSQPYFHKLCAVNRSRVWAMPQCRSGTVHLAAWCCKRVSAQLRHEKTPYVPQYWSIYFWKFSSLTLCIGFTLRVAYIPGVPHQFPVFHPPGRDASKDIFVSFWHIHIQKDTPLQVACVRQNCCEGIFPGKVPPPPPAPVSVNVLHVHHIYI